MAIRVTLTLEPIKVYVQYLQCGWSSWLDGLAQSPSEAVPFNLREGPGVRYSLGRAICGTLGGCLSEKPLPFRCSVRLAFLLGLCWSFKPHL